MKYIKENKYFIFEREVHKNWKFYVKRVLNLITLIGYKFYILLASFKHKKNTVDKKYNISICAIFRNEAKFLKEWIEFHKIIGVEHFYLYNNFSDDNYQEVLKPYILANEVELIEWPVKQGQMKAYQDCLNRFKDETKWIGFIDLDEFIVPINTHNLYEELKPFEGKYPSVLIYWKMFGTSGLMGRDKGSLIIEDFVVGWRKHTNIGKCFINTKYDCVIGSKNNTAMHLLWGRIGKLEIPPVNLSGKLCTFGYNPVNEDGFSVQINHYFTKSYAEYLEKVSRGDAFFEINPRDEEYFYRHEMGACKYDCSAYKYLMKLKHKMSE